MSSTSDFIIETGVLKKYVGSGGDVMIPEGVTEIGREAFSGCKKLLSVTIPAGVKSIGMWALSCCENLKDVVIQDSLTVWDPEVFSYNEWYQVVEGYNRLSIHVEDIQTVPRMYRPFAIRGFLQDAVKDSKSARYKVHKEYLAKNSIKLIPFFFEDLITLQLLCDQKMLPAKYVDDYLMEAEKSGKTELIAMLLDYQNMLSNEVTKVRAKREAARGKYEDALVERIAARDPRKGIEGLTFVVTGTLNEWDSRKNIQEWLEKHGAALGSSITRKTDYLVTNDTESGSEKNRRAKELAVIVIDESAFNRMICWRYPNEEIVIIPSWVKDIAPKALYRAAAVKTVVIPAGIAGIGKEAFRWCTSLKTLRIPETVTNIGADAFSGCFSLKSISIPASVLSIDENAFSGSLKLTIHALAGSYAEQYAKENKIPFVAE